MQVLTVARRTTHLSWASGVGKTAIVEGLALGSLHPATFLTSLLFEETGFGQLFVDISRVLVLALVVYHRWRVEKLYGKVIVETGEISSFWNISYNSRVLESVFSSSAKAPSMP